MSGTIYDVIVIGAGHAGCEAADPVEREGVRRASSAAAAADLLLVIFDISAPFGPGDADLLRDTGGRPRILVANKCDCPCAWQVAALAGNGSAVCEISALTGAGVDALLAIVSERLGAVPETAASPLVTNERHIDLMRRCTAALGRAAGTVEHFGNRAPEELLLVDLNDAREALDEISGRRTPEDVLERIFERFCIGK